MNCNANPAPLTAKESEEDPVRIVGHPPEHDYVLVNGIC